MYKKLEELHIGDIVKVLDVDGYHGYKIERFVIERDAYELARICDGRKILVRPKTEFQVD